MMEPHARDYGGHNDGQLIMVFFSHLCSIHARGVAFVSCEVMFFT